MHTKILISLSTLALLFAGPLLAQTAGSSITLEYGVVKTVGEVHAEAKHAGGTVVGGVAGAAIADDHRGLGALAGGLIGRGIQGHHTSQQVLQQ